MTANIEEHAQGLLEWLHKNPDEVESACIARYVEKHGLDADFGQELVSHLQSRGPADKELAAVGAGIPGPLGRHRLGGPTPNASGSAPSTQKSVWSSLRNYWKVTA